MKTNFTILRFAVLLLIATLSFSLQLKADTAPSMVWHNPVLVSGIAGQPGAEYKFPSVTPGVNAFVTILALNGGAKLTAIDNTTFGYNAAWQPVVKTPAVQGVSTSYVSFRINFKDSAKGNTHIYNWFQLSFIDVDGDNQHVKEFVVAKNPDSVTVSNTTVLTLTSLPGNMVQATGTVANYTDIDTSAYNTNVNFKYLRAGSVNEIRVGNITDASFTVQDRYSCGYFKQISMPFITILPVKYSSFGAVALGNAVTLKWVSEEEINNKHFEVERSLDGINFKTIGIVLDGFEIGTRKNYQYKDNAAELQTKTIAYYRLKQVDNNGKSSFTNTLVVKLQIKADVVMQTSPNPFIENLNIHFSATETGVAEIQIMNFNGQKVVTKQSNISKGYNALQLSGLNNIAAGMYTAQLIINGTVVSSQKIIKK
jgi:hypothetical protein